MNNMFQVSDIRPSWPSCILFVMTYICCTLCNLSIFLLKSSKLRLICWICLLWILSTSFNAFCVSFSKLFMFSGKDLFVCIKYSSNISLSRENVCSSVAILKLEQVSWTDFMLHALCYRTEQTSQTRKKWSQQYWSLASSSCWPLKLCFNWLARLACRHTRFLQDFMMFSRSKSSMTTQTKYQNNSWLVEKHLRWSKDRTRDPLIHHKLHTMIQGKPFWNNKKHDISQTCNNKILTFLNTDCCLTF